MMAVAAVVLALLAIATNGVNIYFIRKWEREQ